MNFVTVYTNYFHSKIFEKKYAIVKTQSYKSQMKNDKAMEVTGEGWDWHLWYIIIKFHVQVDLHKCHTYTILNWPCMSH